METDSLYCPFKHKLPKYCASIHPTTGKAVLVYRGEMGYAPTDLKDQSEVDAFNVSRGVTKTQELAMLNGSCFGWTLAVADPDEWSKIIEEKSA